MTVKEFCNTFSHNNVICVENRDRYWMTCHTGDLAEDQIMDWYLPLSDIADCDIIKISQVTREYPDHHVKDTLTFVVDTDLRDFNIVTTDGAPGWMIEKLTGKSVFGECCG